MSHFSFEERAGQVGREDAGHRKIAALKRKVEK